MTLITCANPIIEERNMRSWDILILTLEERQAQFTKLQEELERQIQLLNASDFVSVKSFPDAGQNSVGFKRNQLLQTSRADYVCFIDDDDWVSLDYIRLLFESIQQCPDCVSLTGLITTNGEDPKYFIHSIRYDHYFEKHGVYYRPPNHLNIVKRSIACQFEFPLQNYKEDTDWAMQICHSGILKDEVEVKSVIYFYQLVPDSSATQIPRPPTCWERIKGNIKRLTN